MLYGEFKARCEHLEIECPTYDEYTYIIEPVYNYHPAFDGNFAKDRCAEIYKACGLGVFLDMGSVAEEAEEMELKCQELRNQFGEAVRMTEVKERELQDVKKRENEAAERMREADERMCAFRESVRNLWRCA